MTRTERDRARLLNKIRAAGVVVPEGAYPAPTYASGAWRRSGAWVWRLHEARGLPVRPPVGSIWPQRQLRGEIEVSQDRFGDWHVDPVQKNLP